MSKLREVLTSAVEVAEGALLHSIQVWTDVQKTYSGNERVLFFAAQRVEMAYIYSYMSKASRGLGVYLSENDADSAKADVYEAFQAIDHMHSKVPGERTKIACDYLLNALDAIKENNIEEARELAYTVSLIADTAKVSVIEHTDLLKQIFSEEVPTIH